MTRVVVDASVAVKWYLEEPQATAARRILSGSFSLWVPGLFFAEFGNVLWKRWRRRELEARVVVDILEALDVVPIEVRAERPLLARAVEIAMNLGSSVYDGLYLALAEAVDARLVTADRAFYRAVAGGPLRERALWVEDVR